MRQLFHGELDEFFGKICHGLTVKYWHELILITRSFSS